MHYPFAGAVSVEVLVGTGNSASWTAKEPFFKVRARAQGNVDMTST